MRPNILMFGDADRNAQRTCAQHERLRRWLSTCQAPLVVEIGAGPDIPSVRYFSSAVLAHEKSLLIRINPREAAVHRAQDVPIHLGALEALQAIDQCVHAVAARTEVL